MVQFAGVILMLKERVRERVRKRERGRERERERERQRQREMTSHDLLVRRVVIYPPGMGMSVHERKKQHTQSQRTDQSEDQRSITLSI